MPDKPLTAPFPYIGGKRRIASEVWRRLGTPKHYIEPFCGSAAMLLAAPQIASLEVIGDVNGFIANFWRAVRHQADQVAHHADYPVSHIDIGARHIWLMEQRAELAEKLQDPHWEGDAKIAGWWVWGQCCWIGHGWCDWSRTSTPKNGKIPQVSDCGRGLQGIGQRPHIGNPGLGLQNITSTGVVAYDWLRRLSDRLQRCRAIHGDWDRCLNYHYGKDKTAVFFDPPYKKYEKWYGNCKPVADQVAEWCAEHPDLKIALCGHLGDYDLPDWEVMRWSRGCASFGSSKTTDQECIWFSPACHKVDDWFTMGG